MHNRAGEHTSSQKAYTNSRDEDNNTVEVAPLSYATHVHLWHAIQSNYGS